MITINGIGEVERGDENRIDVEKGEDFLLHLADGVMDGA